jgi:hypothetical protein
MLIDDFSTDDFIQAGEAALRLPGFKPGMPMVVDGRATLAQPSGEELLTRIRWLDCLRRKGIAHSFALVVAKHRLRIA